MNGFYRSNKSILSKICRLTVQFWPSTVAVKFLDPNAFGKYIMLPLLLARQIFTKFNYLSGSVLQRRLWGQNFPTLKCSNPRSDENFTSYAFSRNWNTTLEYLTKFMLGWSILACFYSTWYQVLANFSETWYWFTLSFP